MPIRTDGIICRECGGSGCSACNDTGYAKAYYLEHPEQHENKTGFADIPIVPMPYGKMLPDLTDCSYPNEDLSEPGDEDYDDFWDGQMRIVCPGCGSDNVVGLSEKYNPEISEENITPGGRWFCISCYDSWCYEHEH